MPSLSPEAQAALDRLAGYNGNRYDATTNRYGLGSIGYQSNGPQAWNDTATVTVEINSIADQTISAANSVDIISDAINTVVSISDEVETVALNAAAVVNASDNMTAIIAAPTHAATATTKANEAAGFRDQAAASAASINLPTLGAGQQSKVLRPKSDGTGYELQDTNAGAGTVVALDGTGKLPAVDGSQLTGIESPGAGGTTASGSVVLTNESPAVQAVTTTGYGQSVTLPDATTLAKGVPHYAISNKGDFDLAIKDAAGTIRGFLSAGESTVAALADNATAAGVWVLPGTRLLGVSAALEKSDVDYGSGTFLLSLSLDATRTLIIFGGTNRYAAVLDEATGTWGTPVLVRANYQSGLAALLIDADEVLVALAGGSSLGAVVLTISGTAITVGSLATAAAGASVEDFGEIVDAGSGSYVLSYGRVGSASCLIAMSVSGTTVTFGSVEVVTNGNNNAPHLYYVAAGVILAVAYNPSTLTVYATPYSVSGAALTVGTAASWSVSDGIMSMRLGTGRVAVFFRSSSTNTAARVVSVSGTVASSGSTVTLTTIGGASAEQCSIGAVADDKIMLVASNISPSSVAMNILTDNAGTAVAGTQVTFSPKTTVPVRKYCIASVVGDVARVVLQPTDRLISLNVDVSTGSPSIESMDSFSFPTSPTAFAGTYINSDTRGRRKGFHLIAAGRAVLAQTLATGQAFVIGEALSVVPQPVPAVNIMAYRDHSPAAGWSVSLSGDTRPQVIQRVTLAQP